MKTIPPTCPEPDNGPKYWRSLDQLAETPEFRQWVEREFPSGASEFNDPVSRRHFVKIMSASFLLAGFGLTGCRKPEENILPFAKNPEGYIHGVPQFYATARPIRGSAIPLLVKASDGRPTKVEGNPNHPASNGGADRYTQASVLNLYDPDRAMRFTKGGVDVQREAALETLSEISKSAAANGGEGVAFLTERSSSPSRERLQKLVSQKLPKARWFAHEPVDFNIHREAASLAAGRSVRPEFHFSKAKRIVSLDCDFIGAEEDAYRLIHGFSSGRRLKKASDDMNRLYVIEGLFTLTGANADHRLRLAPSQIAAAAARLLQEISGGQSSVGNLASQFKGDQKWIAECAKDLNKFKGQTLVVAGYQQPLVVHLIAHAINQALGANGKTISYLPVPETKEGSIEELAAELNGGKIQTLFIFGANPVYTAPADLQWAKAQAKAKNVVRLGYYEDETAALSTLHLPAAHYLESWGDARTGDGTYVSIQPLIEPLFGGLTEIEVLARIAGSNAVRPYDIVRETFKDFSKGNFEEAWKKFLHDGFVPGSAAEAVSANSNSNALQQALQKASVAPAPTAQQLEVVFHRDYKVDDGRYNNNGWLQELPDPISKITWENTILLSPKTAETFGLRVVNHEDNLLFVPTAKIKVNGAEIEGPVWVQPGQADNIVGLALGYGREKTGRVGRGTGFNAYKLRTSTTPYFAPGATLTATGGKHQLSTTQDHGSMEGRPIIREANLEEYRKNPAFAKGMNLEAPPITKPIYPNPLDERKKTALHQWGMVIDLTTCVGCNSCAIACQSENNVPIVGKEQVGRNREMHWLRIDRYFSGGVDDPQMIYQPMFCQHCEAAPCENVCPVNATSHDEEGLNVMTYNRCVGTRYCSNNCPYKVRRFNFFDYNKRTPEQLHGPFYPDPITGKVAGQWGVKTWAENPEQGYRTGVEWDLYKMAKNPDVTVRMRGVMEKCTFCLQRIEGAKISQKVKAGASGDVRLKEAEGTIPKTACQQACPAEAIIFGDISDPESSVSQWKENDRNYSVLEFLATKPRVTYLAKVRNQNPEMPDYVAIPYSASEFKEANHQDPYKVHGSEHHEGEEKFPQAEGGPSKKGAH
jgi:molybdopterin-containing oxidoreductase family iron-sulfur binding subunit